MFTYLLNFSGSLTQNLRTSQHPEKAAHASLSHGPGCSRWPGLFEMAYFLVQIFLSTKSLLASSLSASASDEIIDIT